MFETPVQRNPRTGVIIFVLFVLATLFGYMFFLRKQPTHDKILFATPTPTKTLKDSLVAPELPKDWAYVKADEEEVIFKTEKKSADNFPPAVVLIASTSDKEITDPKAYVDELVKGARLTIPSLTITKNVGKTGDELYTRDIVGFYINGGVRINIRQQIHVTKKDVYTITGSYMANSRDLTISKDMDDIFTKMFVSLLDK